MKRSELEHIIRSATAIANQYEIIVIGSQSILGAAPDAPEELLRSMEADVFTPDGDDSLSDLIDGSIGEGSLFHERFGYYAQGVGPKTAILPTGWQERLVRVQNQNTDLKVGLCLDPVDLACSKLAAGREKDFEFVAALLGHCVITAPDLRDRLESMPIHADQHARLSRWIDGFVLAPHTPRRG